MAAVACGIDWAQDHHDVALVDENGVVLASTRIRDDAAGLGQVLALLAEHDPAGGKLPIAIETSQEVIGDQVDGRAWRHGHHHLPRARTEAAAATMKHRVANQSSLTAKAIERINSHHQPGASAMTPSMKAG